MRGYRPAGARIFLRGVQAIEARKRMPKAFKAVSFDMGYTLVHSVKSALDIYAEGFKALGLDVPEDRIREAAWRVWTKRSEAWAREIWEASQEADRQRNAENRRLMVREMGLPEDILPELNEYIDKEFSDPSIYALFPDSLESVRRLKESGFVVGITSNWSWNLPEVCDYLGLAPYLDFVVASARVGAVKPHPYIFQQTVERAGVPAPAIVHIGDDVQADVIGALKAGLNAALIDRIGDIPKDGLPDGVPVFRSLLDFAAWISGSTDHVSPHTEAVQGRFGGS